MTVRGGGRPTMVRGCNTPQGRMGPLPRSFAADAHDCIMVQALIEPTGYKCAAGFFIPLQKARSPR